MWKKKVPLYRSLKSKGTKVIGEKIEVTTSLARSGEGEVACVIRKGLGAGVGWRKIKA